MPVELDVENTNGRLSSGMFPEVLWPVRRSEPTLFVPASAVASTTEATFVIRIHDGNAEWVNVQSGEQDGKAMEVFGSLHEGDEVAARAPTSCAPEAMWRRNRLPSPLPRNSATSLTSQE
jgi:hypothetical protein